MSEWTQERIDEVREKVRPRLCAACRDEVPRGMACSCPRRAKREWSMLDEIERLRGELDRARESVTAWGHDDGNTHMGDVVERLCKRIKRTDDDYRELVLETDAREQRLRERIAALEDAQRWIPVEERLPEDGVSVEVYVPEWSKGRCAGVVVTHCSGRRSYNWDLVKSGALGVTHWRPLGPLPGEESEE